MPSPTPRASYFHEWVKKWSLSWGRRPLAYFFPQLPSFLQASALAPRLWLLVCVQLEGIPGAVILRRCLPSRDVWIQWLFTSIVGDCFGALGCFSLCFARRLPSPYYCRISPESTLKFLSFLTWSFLPRLQLLYPLQINGVKYNCFLAENKSPGIRWCDFSSQEMVLAVFVSVVCS